MSSLLCDEMLADNYNYHNKENIRMLSPVSVLPDQTALLALRLTTSHIFLVCLNSFKFQLEAVSCAWDMLSRLQKTHTCPVTKAAATLGCLHIAHKVRLVT